MILYTNILLFSKVLESYFLAGVLVEIIEFRDFGAERFDPKFILIIYPFLLL